MKDRLVYDNRGKAHSRFFQQHDLYKSAQYRTHLTPHIFWIADQAYRKVCLSKKSQCIAVTGESGAGMIDRLFNFKFTLLFRKNRINETYGFAYNSLFR